MRDIIFIILLLFVAVPPLMAQENRVYGGAITGAQQHDGNVYGGFGGFEVRIPADFSIRVEGRADLAKKLYLNRYGKGWGAQFETTRKIVETANGRLIVRLLGGVRGSGFLIGGPGGYEKHAVYVTAGAGLIGKYSTHGLVYLDARWLHNTHPTDRNNRARGLQVVGDVTIPVAWRWQPFYGVEYHWQHAYQPTGEFKGWHKFHDFYWRFGITRRQ